MTDDERRLSSVSCAPPTMCLSELPRDTTIERGIIPLLLRLQRNRRQLERVQDVAEVELCERADRIVRHDAQRTAGVSAVVPSVPFPSAAVT